MSGPKRIHIGQKLKGIRAGDHNGFVDAYQRVFGLPGLGSGTGASVGATRLTVMVKSAVAVDSDFPVLQIDGPVFNIEDRSEAFLDAITLKGKTPVSGATTSDIVIVQGPVGSGANAIRQAVLLGPTWCDVDVTDEDHTHAQVDVGDNSKLKSGSDGARILWKESGTGTKKALIMLSPSAVGGGSIIIARSPVGGIAGRNDTNPDQPTCGSAECDLYNLVVETGEVVDRSESKRVFNLAVEGIDGEKWLGVIPSESEGALLCVWEECDEA